MASDYDSKIGIHPLPVLKTGTIVILQDGCTDPIKQWRVIEQHRQQVGVTDGRRILLRNRRDVRQYNSTAQESELELQLDRPLPDNPRPTNLTPVRSGQNISRTPTALPIPPDDKLPSSTQSQLKETLQTNPQPPEETFDTTATNRSDNAKTDSTEANKSAIGEPSLYKPEQQSLYKEGTVTRSGRQVKLSQKAREADIYIYRVSTGAVGCVVFDVLLLLDKGVL